MQATLPDWPPLAAARIVREVSTSPLTQSWLVESASGLQVLRVDQPAAVGLTPARSGELSVLQAIDGSAIGPAAGAVDVDRGLSLVEYLSGRPLTPSELSDAQRVAQIAELLVRLHSLEVQGLRQLPVLDLAAAARRYAGVAADAASLRDVALVEQLAPRLVAEAGPLVLAHNDVHPGNLVVCDDNTLRLIDWEYAALGPRAFELASFIEQTGLSAAMQQVLLDTYAKGAHRGWLDSLPSWCELYRCIDRLWRRAIESAGQSGDY